MPATPGLPRDQAGLYARLGKRLDAVGGVRGGFAGLVARLGTGTLRGYVSIGPRTSQWCRLLRNAYRAFQGDLEVLLTQYGSVPVLWGAKLRAAGQLAVRKGRLLARTRDGKLLDLAAFSRRELERLLAQRPHRVRHPRGRQATSGAPFELPKDLHETAAFLGARLKSLAPGPFAKMSHFAIAVGKGNKPTAADLIGIRRITATLRELLAIYRDVVEYLDAELGRIGERSPDGILRHRGEGQDRVTVAVVPIDDGIDRGADLVRRLTAWASARRPVGKAPLVSRRSKSP